jgi:uncharacterized protein (TIGR02246 family)
MVRKPCSRVTPQNLKSEQTMRAVGILTLVAAMTLCGASRSAPMPPEAAATQVFKDYLQAWDRADAQAIAAQFAPDGDFINPTGFYARGPAEVESFYRAAFDHGYAGSKGGFIVKAIRPIARGVIAVDGVWSIEGALDPTGRAKEAERGLATGILVLRPEGWRVALLREQSSAQTLEIPATNQRKSLHR